MRNGHRYFVFERRTRVLAELLAAQIPQGASVLDIGCGDGAIASLIVQGRPDISIQGVEFLVRHECQIESPGCARSSLPFPAAALDRLLVRNFVPPTVNTGILDREATRCSP